MKLSNVKFARSIFNCTSQTHEPKTKKINSVDDVWKSEEEITKTRLNVTSIFLRNTALFEKYVQIFVSRTSFDFKTPRLCHAISTLHGVWKSEEVLLLVFEVLLKQL